MANLYGNANPNVPSTDQINVSQYGWSDSDMEQVNQLFDYVAQVKKLVEDLQLMQVDYLKIKPLYDAIVLMESDIRNMSTDTTTIYNNIQTINSQITQLSTQVTTAQQDVNVKYGDIVGKFNDIVNYWSATMLVADVLLDIQTKVEADKADVSSMKTDVEQIYAQLKDGRVYMGIWNPNSGAYPTVPTKTSFWDVALNAGQVDHDFDGKTWTAGDTLIYLLDTSSFNQIESGKASGVDSVNNKKGAVTLNNVDVGAAPIGFGLGTTGKSLSNASADTATASGFYSVFQSTTDVPTGTQSGSTMIVSAWGPNNISQVLYGTNNRVFVRNKVGSPAAWSNWIELFTAYHKPTAADVGALSSTDNTVMKVRPAGSDFSACILPGIYYMSANNTNGPTQTGVGNYGVLQVLSNGSGQATGNGNWITQIYHNHTTPKRIFTRNAVNGSWGSWLEIYTDSNKPTYTAADVGAAPTSHTHTTANVTGLDTALAAKMPIAGGTFTGAVSWATAPTTGNHLVNKTYADTKFDKVGGNISGDVVLTNTNIGITRSLGVDRGTKRGLFNVGTAISSSVYGAQIGIMGTDGKRKYIGVSESSIPYYHDGTSAFEILTTKTGRLSTGAITSNNSVILSGAYDGSWGASTNPSAVKIISPDDSQATWLIGSYGTTENSTFRAGIQVVNGTAGDMRLYTNQGNKYISITGGNVRAADNTQDTALGAYAKYQWVGDNYVPKTITINNKALSANITISASDLGAPTLTGANAFTNVNSFSTYGGATFASQGTNFVTARFYNGSGTHWNIYTAVNNNLIFSTGGAANALTSKMWIDPSTGIVSAADFNVTSDFRLKRDFDTIDGALDKVCQLRGLTYDKYDPDGEFLKRESGIIAQELRKVLPEAVSEMDNGFLSISPSATIALLVEAIKELKDEIDELKRGNR